MKIGLKILLLLCIAVGSSCSHKTPQGRTYPDYSVSSGFTLDKADSTTLDNLDVLGRVWGYVKYHHPVFAGDNVDADYELFGLLPRIAQGDKPTRNRILTEWIAGLGPYETVDESHYKAPSGTESRQLTQSPWITEERLGRELADELHRMRLAKRTSNRYIRQSNGAGNPELTSERRAGKATDCGYRLLALYRFWNVLEYFNPNRNITDRDWNTVLTEFLPGFIETTDSANLNRLFARLNAATCDGHASGPEYRISGSRFLPAEGRYFGERLIVTDTSAYFLPGDEIVAVDSLSRSEFLKEMEPCIAASNPDAQRRYAAVTALMSFRDTVDVEYIRNGKRQRIRIPTEEPETHYQLATARNTARHTTYRLLSPSVGYLYAGGYTAAEAEKMMEAFGDTKALIVDLRCYPKEFMIFNFIGKYFIKQPVCHVQFATPNPQMPGQLWIAKTQLTTDGLFGTQNPDYYKGKVLVLVDETTQSQAEYTTMAFQTTPRCTVIGSRTAGADGDVTVIPLPCGLYTRFSGLGVYYPDGTDTQRAGVRIDVEVHPTIEGIRAGRDEVLERAIQIASAAE